jgi:predicted type IV restriction endonuclease
MDLIDHVQALSARLSKQLDHIQTEEATKNALVLPFINALGYNVFDPTEVVPEFTADVGTKKGEKVDYAIQRDGHVLMLIECKHAGSDLSINHASQLFRYFHVTDARIAILTNGIIYKFFSDLEEPNKMDERPFLEFDVRDPREDHVAEIKKLTKSAFDIDELLSTASELKYLKEIRRVMAEQVEDPSEDFLRFFVGEVYNGRFTQGVRNQFHPLVKKGINQFINERINARLKNALEEGDKKDRTPPPATAEEVIPDDGVVTTAEELEGFHIVKAILRQVIDPARIVERDVKSYFGVLLDNNNRKAICRLHFNGSQKYVEIFDVSGGEKLPIDNLNDMYGMADRLKAAVARHEGKQE